jgi:hypothetical protein
MKSLIKLAFAVSALASVASSANAYDYSTYSAMMTATATTTDTTTYPTVTTYPTPTYPTTTSEPTTTTCDGSGMETFDMDEFEAVYGMSDSGCMTMSKGAPKKKVCILTLAGTPPTSVNKGKQTKADCDTLCKGQTSPKCVSFTWGQ